jgi:hypothetical protein
MKNRDLKTKPLIEGIRHTIMSSALVLLTLLVPCSLLAGGPIVVKINDIANGPPEVEVDGAPKGWNFCSGACAANLGIINPSGEDGGVINLFGVDTYGSINEPYECGWRFLDPDVSLSCRALDIIWIQHDYFGPYSNGDLQIAFNSILAGGHYCGLGCDASLGPLTYKWQVVYSDATVVVLFKAQKPGK